MARKKRKVEILSTKLEFLSKNSNNPRFSEILDFINGREIFFPDKDFEFKLLPTTLVGCKVGVVETMQNKDLPPKKDIQKKTYSPLGIDLKKEKLVFANAFLYDEVRNIFIYEVNRNGCFPDKLIESIYALWNNNPSIKFNLTFPFVLKKDEYNRALRITNYRKIRVELLNPKELVDTFEDETDSVESRIVRQNVESAAQNNADTLVLEQLATTKKLNPSGMSHKFVKGMLDSVLNLMTNKEARHNIKELKVAGYFEDPEEGKSLRTVNLLTDTFDEAFYIQDVELQADIQIWERKAEIEALYEKLLPKFKAIIGK